jgi:cation diffusion facilitator CzcD-associated flavoprotein CzcO
VDIKHSEIILEVAVVGAGFTGLGAGIQLKRAGITNFRIFEQAAALGGVWRDNRYPGLCCDIPSHLYSYSFAPNADWSRRYAPGREIWAYQQRCHEQFGVGRFISYGMEVVAATYDEQAALWVLDFRSGEQARARYLISMSRGLSLPQYPKIEGIEAFAGAAMHTACWDDNYDFRGKHVAVIGNGASGIQAIPQLAKVAASVTVFQRTPSWVLPRKDRAYSALSKALFRWLPGAQRLHRLQLFLTQELIYPALKNPGGIMHKALTLLATTHLNRTIGDPVLRQKLTPNFAVGCKRVLVSDDYYPSFLLPHVSLQTAAITGATENEVICADGSRHRADVLVYSTGFKNIGEMPFTITGKHGKTLAQVWGQEPAAYLGVVTAGFPNLFTVLGPNSAFGHQSALFVIERHVNYIVRCIRHAGRKEWRSMDVRGDVQHEYNEMMQQRFKGMVWSGSCPVWFKNEGGRIVTNTPDSGFGFWRRLMRPNFDEFVVEQTCDDRPTSGARYASAASE